MTSQPQVLGQVYSTRHKVLINHIGGLEFNQKAIGCSHKFPITLAAMAHLVRSVTVVASVFIGELNCSCFF